MKVIGIGRLVNDPELRKTNSGVSTVKFTLACRRKFKNQQTGEYDSDFITCQAWRNQADFIANYVKKGNQVFVEGEWQTGKYENNEGRTIYTNDLVVDNIQLLEKKEQASQPSNGADTSYFGNTLDIAESDLPF